MKTVSANCEISTSVFLLKIKTKIVKSKHQSLFFSVKTHWWESYGLRKRFSFPLVCFGQHFHSVYLYSVLAKSPFTLYADTLPLHSPWATYTEDTDDDTSSSGSRIAISSHSTMTHELMMKGLINFGKKLENLSTGSRH